MKNKKSEILFVLAIVALSACGASAQGSAFTDPSVEYTFTVPEDKWTMVVKPSATNPNVEYVYGDRRDGYLTIRKLTVGKDAVMSDVIQDEAQNVQFRPGYVANKDEIFAGKLKGTVFNFEYVAASRPAAGRYYFLRANPTTVYVLRFTGAKDSMRSLRAQTDMIARTFSLK
ncbi:MAG TPA: hypothetical protein VGI80_04330 [Pyrinomonadaceae bacterium]